MGDLTSNFSLYEFVPPEIYNRFEAQSTRFIDHRIPAIAQKIRDIFGYTIINDWKMGGPYNNSGYRSPLCLEGSNFSAHKRGMAIDIKIINNDPQEIRNYIINNYIEIFKPLGVTVIELNTPTWIHVGTENFRNDNIQLIDFWRD